MQVPCCRYLYEHSHDIRCLTQRQETTQNEVLNAQASNTGPAVFSRTLQRASRYNTHTQTHTYTHTHTQTHTHEFKVQSQTIWFRNKQHITMLQCCIRQPRTPSYCATANAIDKTIHTEALISMSSSCVNSTSVIRLNKRRNRTISLSAATVLANSSSSSEMLSPVAFATNQLNLIAGDLSIMPKEYCVSEAASILQISGVVKTDSEDSNHTLAYLKL